MSENWSKVDKLANLQNMKDIDISEVKDGKRKISVEKYIGHKEYKNAGIFLIYQGKTLLLKLSYSDKKWATPGGKVDKGEGALEAALREMQEETGIEIKIAKLKTLRTDVYKPTNTKLFVMEVTEEPIVKISDEHTAWKMVDLKDVLKEDLMGYARGAFEQLKL